MSWADASLTVGTQWLGQPNGASVGTQSRAATLRKANMLLKGNISITVELGEKEYSIKPFGVAFGKLFFGVLHMQSPRSPTLRAPVQSEQGGQHLDSSYDEYEGTTFNPKKVSARPTRSDGG